MRTWFLKLTKIASKTQLRIDFNTKGVVMSKEKNENVQTQETYLEKLRRERKQQEQEAEQKLKEKKEKEEAERKSKEAPIIFKGLPEDKGQDLKTLFQEDAEYLKERDKELSLKQSQKIDKFKLSYIEDYEEEEAKKLIEECLGFEPIRTCGFNMAVKVYVRPQDVRQVVRSDGSVVSLYLPDEARAHDKFVNCVGLVISQGPLCYIGDFFQEHWAKRLVRKFFGDFMKPSKLVPWCKVGDWVVFDRNAGPQVNYRGVPVTLIHDKHVRSVVPDPTYVTRY